MSNPSLRKDLESLLNKYSAENPSNTPDFILAGYMIGCLEIFEAAVNGRETWYGRKPVSFTDTPVTPLTPAPEEKPPEDEGKALIWHMERGKRYRYRTCQRCGASYDFYKKGKLFFFSSQCKCNGMAPECINRVSEAAILGKMKWLKPVD